MKGSHSAGEKLTDGVVGGGGGVEKLRSRQLITGNVAPHLSRGK